MQIDALAEYRTADENFWEHRTVECKHETLTRLALGFAIYHANRLLHPKGHGIGSDRLLVFVPSRLDSDRSQVFRQRIASTLLFQENPSSSLLCELLCKWKEFLNTPGHAHIRRTHLAREGARQCRRPRTYDLSPGRPLLRKSLADFR